MPSKPPRVGSVVVILFDCWFCGVGAVVEKCFEI